MKKLVFGLILTTTVALSSKAQVYIQGGLNLANITKTSDGQTSDNNILPSFNVGLLGRYGITSNFAIESGALLTGHGSKAETYFNGGNDYVKSRFNPLYLEVPLNVVLNIPLPGKTGLFFNAGPYMAVGVGGKSKTDSKILGITSSSENPIKFSNDDPFTSQQDDAAYDKLKRFDFGINLGGGFDFKKLIVKANYGYGLAKINSTQSNNTANDKNKYRTVSVSLGIPLGR